ncbi:hypothetical protein CS022_13745 [Veronia nyctiphanis]|uniref:Uncharacterized protein n=1 Tax=Veronia nyctiphanis TaxID=1278244 RepID=A0A4V1LSS3_9GAMM|nr:hypothetical protein [Veronia nyctiphanis]RXJ72698.1 hypothetical protein CS022_13745 [Veronia nyctiphanis]
MKRLILANLIVVALTGCEGKGSSTTVFPNSETVFSDTNANSSSDTNDDTNTGTDSPPSETPTGDTGNNSDNDNTDSSGSSDSNADTPQNNEPSNTGDTNTDTGNDGSSGDSNVTLDNASDCYNPNLIRTGYRYEATYSLKIENQNFVTYDSFSVLSPATENGRNVVSVTYSSRVRPESSPNQLIFSYYTNNSVALDDSNKTMTQFSSSNYTDSSYTRYEPNGLITPFDIDEGETIEAPIISVITSKGSQSQVSTLKLKHTFLGHKQLVFGNISYNTCEFIITKTRTINDEITTTSDVDYVAVGTGLIVKRIEKDSVGNIISTKSLKEFTPLPDAQ